MKCDGISRVIKIHLVGGLRCACVMFSVSSLPFVLRSLMIDVHFANFFCQYELALLHVITETILFHFQAAAVTGFTRQQIQMNL